MLYRFWLMITCLLYRGGASDDIWTLVLPSYKLFNRKRLKNFHLWPPLRVLRLPGINYVIILKAVACNWHNAVVAEIGMNEFQNCHWLNDYRLKLPFFHHVCQIHSFYPRVWKEWCCHNYTLPDRWHNGSDVSCFANMFLYQMFTPEVFTFI